VEQEHAAYLSGGTVVLLASDEIPKVTNYSKGKKFVKVKIINGTVYTKQKASLGSIWLVKQEDVEEIE